MMTTATYTTGHLSLTEPILSPRISPFDYALFTLPHVLLNGVNVVTHEKAAVIIPFHATAMLGMTGSFTLKPGNGVTAKLSVVYPGDMCRREDEYEDEVPLRMLMMESERPTLPGAGDHRSGFLIQPLIPWLEPGQRFHVFRISFGCRHRAQDHTFPQTPAIPDLLFGIQRPD